MSVLRGIRSLISVVLVGLLFILGSLVLRLAIVPGCWAFPGKRHRLVSVYMKAMAHGILSLLSLGGARFRRIGVIPTGSPVLVVANHQSLLDILQTALLCRPGVPAFVTRKRYARFVPLVSACVRLLGAPVIDPKRDPARAIETIRKASRELPHGLLIFPEGHRSRTGEILPFRAGGFETTLRERRMPVYLVLNEGLWRVRRFVDLLFRTDQIDAVAEVMGPFAAPEEPAELARFLQVLRDKLSVRQAEYRRTPSLNT